MVRIVSTDRYLTRFLLDFPLDPSWTPWLLGGLQDFRFCLRRLIVLSVHARGKPCNPGLTITILNNQSKDTTSGLI